MGSEHQTHFEPMNEEIYLLEKKTLPRLSVRGKTFLVPAVLGQGSIGLLQAPGSHFESRGESLLEMKQKRGI